MAMVCRRGGLGWPQARDLAQKYASGSPRGGSGGADEGFKPANGSLRRTLQVRSVHAPFVCGGESARGTSAACTRQGGSASPHAACALRAV